MKDNKQLIILMEQNEDNTHLLNKSTIQDNKTLNETFPICKPINKKRYDVNLEIFFLSILFPLKARPKGRHQVNQTPSFEISERQWDEREGILHASY